MPKILRAGRSTARELSDRSMLDIIIVVEITFELMDSPSLTAYE